MNSNKTKKTIQFTFIVLGLIGTLVFLSTILIKPILEKTLRAEIKNLLKDVYTFDFSDININLIGGGITLKELSLKPTEKILKGTYEQENIYTIQIEKFHINGLGYLPFFKRQLNISNIEIINPVVSISSGKNKSKDSTEKINFYSLIENKIKNLNIKYIHISGGRLRLMKPEDSKNDRFSIRNFFAELSNLKIDSSIAAKNAGWPQWENLKIRSISNHYLLPDKKHQLDIPELSWTDKDCVLVISKIHFSDFKNLSSSQLSIKINELRGEQIDLQAMLKGQIKIKNIVLSQPLTSIVIPPKAASQAPPDVENILIQNFPHTQISSIKIVNGDLSLENKKKKYKVYIHNFNHSYDSISINVATDHPTEFARPGIQFEAQHVRIIFPDSMYVFTGENLKVGKTKNEVTLSNAVLAPQYSKAEFSKKLKIQDERIELKCPLLRLQGIDIYDILLEQKIIARSIEIPKLTLYAYRDKNYPAQQRMKILPAMALMKMEEYIKIDFLKIDDANILYEEKLPDNKGYNKVEFTKIKASILNITNDKIATAKPLLIVASGLIYGKGHINAKAIFQLKSKIGNFSLEGNSKIFDMKYLNSILESSASLSVKHGFVDSMSFKLNGNDTIATGKMKLYYHDLKLNVLNRKTSTKHGLKAEIGTFLIDKMLVKSENPAKNGDIREGEILFNRDRQKSIFNMLAKSLLSGVLSTVAPAVSEIKNRKEQ